MRAVRGAFWLALTGLCACDPYWGVRTRVLAAPACSSSSVASAEAVPIEGATVSIHCPESSRIKSVQTNPQGSAQIGFVGFMPGCELGRCSDDPNRPAGGHAMPSCEVVIEKEGFVPQRHPLGPFCQAYADDRCFRVALTVTLSPAGTLAAKP